MKTSVASNVSPPHEPQIHGWHHMYGGRAQKHGKSTVLHLLANDFSSLGMWKVFRSLVEEYFDELYILITDTLTWTKLVTSGELLPPRAGHTTIALGKYVFVFGGFTNVEDLYDDLYMFDFETFM